MDKIDEEKKIEELDDKSLNKQQELLSENISENPENIEDFVVKGKDNFFSRLVNKHKTKKEEKRKKVEIENNSLSKEESEKINQQLDEANKEAKKVNSKKQKITSILLLVFNIVLVVALLLWNLLGSDEFTPLNLLDVHIWPFLIFLLFIVLNVFCDTISAHRMIYRKTYRSRWALAYKTIVTLRYYDSVIPLSGGEAFAVSYLANRDVPGATALSIPVAKMIFQQITWIGIGLFCLIYAQFVPQFDGFVTATSIIGFIISFSAIFIVIFVSLSKNLGKKLVSWFTKLLYKLHIVKDYDKQYAKYLKFIEDYQAIIREYSKAKWDILLQFFLSIIRYVTTYSSPFLIYCIFKGFPATGGAELYTTFFVSAALIEFASSFIPLPGGSGMNEITFTVIFSQFLQGETFWALLLWRFTTYYFYLIQGLSVITYDTLYGNKKYKWVKKRLALQQESQIFKKQQIDMFRAERNKRRKREKVGKNLYK